MASNKILNFQPNERQDGRRTNKIYQPLDRLAPALAMASALSFFVTKVHAMETNTKANVGASQGTAQLTLWAHLPDVPNIVNQWAALVPLTVYLSNMRSNYELAGEVSLRARLSVSVMPKLWELGSIAKLLREKELFLDSASASGDPLTVWDVQWGSIFPCYNSAATLGVIAAALAGRVQDSPEITQQDLNRWLHQHENELKRRFPSEFVGHGQEKIAEDVYCGEEFQDLIHRKNSFGRRQVLNIISVAHDGRKPRMGQPAHPRWKYLFHFIPQVVVVIGIGAFLISLGCIGSGTLLVIGGLSHCFSQMVEIKRSPLYLHNRETHQGCMLVASHDNATIWTLYVGERGLIDSLLNKPMVEIGNTHPLILNWFRFAEILQVCAMTYVAGEMGWDAIFLLILIAIWSITQFNARNKHATSWLREERYTTKVFACEFTGRSELLGAVQLLSTEKNTYWMKDILAPAPRRDVWLQKVGVMDSEPDSLAMHFASLNKHDQLWINATGMQTLAGYHLIKQRLEESRDAEAH